MKAILTVLLKKKREITKYIVVAVCIARCTPLNCNFIVCKILFYAVKFKRCFVNIN